MAKSKTVAAKAAVKKTATKKAPAKKVTVKKATPKSAIKEKKEPTINIKYADKSAGQPELLEIFEAIKKMMQPYDKKRNLVLHTQTGGQANLVSHKPVEIAGRKRNELWFVSALVQKGYVGFYYTPVYMQGELKKHFSEDFIKSLKGKACFHIKKNDPVIMADIKKAIRVGYETFIERGWI